MILANFWFHSWFPVASLCNLVLSWINSFWKPCLTAEPPVYGSQPSVTVCYTELLMREGTVRLQGEWVGTDTLS